ncbi:MAG: retropepsin-like aspartic protease [Planctomycetota bacterium]
MCFWIVFSMIVIGTHLEVDGLAPVRVREQVRDALGYGAFVDLDHGVELAGRISGYRGSSGRYRARVAGDGRLRETIRCEVGEETGFDGAEAWTADWTGWVRPLEHVERVIQISVRWIQWGLWLGSGSQFEVVVDRDESDESRVVVWLRFPGADIRQRLEIDRATWRPRKLTSSLGVFHFEDYRSALGAKWPHRVVIQLGLEKRVVEIESIQPIEKDGGFAAPRSEARWSAEEEEELEARLDPRGHLFVKPRIDGEERGWFLLDSGAEVLIVTPALAESLKMEEVGRMALLDSGGGALSSRIVKGKQFQLGGLTIPSPIFSELDDESLQRHSKEPVVGICGFDVFARAVVTVDLEVGSAQLSNPSEPEKDPLPWQRLVLDGRTPTVLCRFEGDREALFELDTGNNGGVILQSAAVDHFDLRSGRRLAPTGFGVPSGVVGVLAGRLEWLELGGHRIENVLSYFPKSKPAHATQTSYAGTIGRELMRRFRVIFDVPHRRIAFMPR